VHCRSTPELDQVRRPRERRTGRTGRSPESCDFEPNEQNAIEDYLQRRGWKDPVPVKRYLKALRGSIMSLYAIPPQELT
jgi:hypothetical protein